MIVLLLAERHRDKGTEHKLLQIKSDQGISFFTSQLVYNADNAIALLTDYDALCRYQLYSRHHIVLTSIVQRFQVQARSNYLCFCTICKSRDRCSIALPILTRSSKFFEVARCGTSRRNCEKSVVKVSCANSVVL